MSDLESLYLYEIRMIPTCSIPTKETRCCTDKITVTLLPGESNRWPLKQDGLQLNTSPVCQVIKSHGVQRKGNFSLSLKQLWFTLVKNLRGRFSTAVYGARLDNCTTALRLNELYCNRNRTKNS